MREKFSDKNESALKAFQEEMRKLKEAEEKGSGTAHFMKTHFSHGLNPENLTETDMRMWREVQGYMARFKQKKLSWEELEAYIDTTYYSYRTNPHKGEDSKIFAAFLANKLQPMITRLS